MSIEDLRTAWQTAEAKAQAIMAEKDEAIDKVRAKYTDKLRSATQDAADAQKAFLDADAVSALADRDDGFVVAKSLGLLDAADAVGVTLAGDNRD
jgi:predicted DNA-binding protein (UPF0278 family)